MLEFANTSRDIGLKSEAMSLRYLFINGYTPLLGRSKFLGIEVDQLALDQQSRLCLFEVKSLSSSFYQGQRVSRQQYLRLRRVRSYLQKHLRIPVLLKFSFVKDLSRVEIIDELHFKPLRY